MAVDPDYHLAAGVADTPFAAGRVDALACEPFRLSLRVRDLARSGDMRHGATLEENPPAHATLYPAEPCCASVRTSCYTAGMTSTTTVRIPEDLKTAALKAAGDLRVSFSDVTRDALAEYLARPQGAAAGQSVIRDLQAENASLKAQLEAARAALARAAAPDRSRGGTRNRAMTRDYAAAEDRFAAAFAQASPDSPVTPAFMALATGMDADWCGRRLLVLTASGHGVKIRRGEYCPADGMTGKDIRAALNGTHGRLLELAAGAAQEARERPAGNGRLDGARDRAAAPGAPVVAARDLPRPGAAADRGPAAIFKPADAAGPVLPVHDIAPAGRERGRSRKRCDHRLPPGAWCKTCQQPK